MSAQRLPPAQPHKRPSCIPSEIQADLAVNQPGLPAFRLYWAWPSRTRRVGRKRPLTKDLRDLIFRMVAESPTWGAPRIHGEILKLGFDISERTVSRWLKRANHNPDPARRWLSFLRNHREAIAAMDFFKVPTLTFGVLYCFFVIGRLSPQGEVILTELLLDWENLSQSLRAILQQSQAGPASESGVPSAEAAPQDY